MGTGSDLVGGHFNYYYQSGEKYQLYLQYFQMVILNYFINFSYNPARILNVVVNGTNIILFI